MTKKIKNVKARKANAKKIHGSEKNCSADPGKQ